MSKTTDLYFIRCLSNTHMGSGDITYGIVDRQVQRDTITELPVIHSSGLKGSLRELMATLKNPADPIAGDKHPMVNGIFGSNKEGEKYQDKKLKPGSHFFYDAYLLALPVRSNVRPFFRATSPYVLKEFAERQAKIQGDDSETWKKRFKNLIDLSGEVVKGTPIVFNEKESNIRLEYWTAQSKEMEVKEASEFLGEPVAIFHHDDFKELCNRLPVIARNNLENGISQNLWYEEVVPRESLFYSFISRPSEELNAEGENGNGVTLEETIQPDHLYETISSESNNLIQVGGSASIGYGLCEIQKQ